MVILLLDESSLHPLTQELTFQLSNPERRDWVALKSTNEFNIQLQAAVVTPCTATHSCLHILDILDACSIAVRANMFVDERILTLFKRNAHHTLTYWSVFFSFGLCIAFLGPTILDLQCQTNSTLSQITWVFFSQQFCLLIGSSIGGVFKRT